MDFLQQYFFFLQGPVRVFLKHFGIGNVLAYGLVLYKITFMVKQRLVYPLLPPGLTVFFNFMLI